MKKLLLLFFLLTFSLGYSQPGASPTDPIARNAWDVQSVYSDSYTNQTGVSFQTFGGVTSIGDFTPPGGNVSKVYVGHSFSGIQVNTAGSLDVSQMTHLHFDVWSPNFSSMNIKLESSTTTARELAVTGAVVPSASTRNQWIGIDLALSTYNLGNILTSLKYIVPVTFGQNATLYIDNVYFYRPTTANPPPTITNFPAISKVTGDAPFTLTQPTSNSAGAWTYSSGTNSVATISGNTVTIAGAGTSVITATQAADGIYTAGSITATLTVTPPAAPVPPARNSWDVVSFYSGSYTNSSIPTWGGSASSDVSLGGNTARSLTSLTSAQIAFASTNVSAMTHLHIDVYSLNQANLWFWLMSQRVDLPTPINGWTSIDIPLSTYAGLGINLSAINLFRIENPTGAGLPAKNAYVDNIYFYRAATDTPPTLGALTVPSPKVFGDAPFTLTNPTSNSSGAWTYSSSPAGVVTFSGNTATIISGGTTTITATQAAVPGSFGSGSASASLVVNFLPPGPSPIPPARDPASVVSMYTGTPTTYANGTTAVQASWSTGSTNSNFNFANGTNTCIQVNNLGFFGLVTNGANFSVVGMSHLHVDIYVNSPMTTMILNLLAPSDRNYSIGPLVAGWNSFDIPLTTYPGALNNINGIKFEQSGGTPRQIYIDNVYFYYTPTVPTISNFSSVAKVMGAAPFTLNATSTSPAAITYSSDNPLVATISGNTVTVVGVGSCTLTASQAATGSFAAGSATATLTVTGSTTPLAGPTAPPARNSWDVISVFSDAAYTQAPGTRTYNPGWGQAGSASVVSLAGDNAWRATNLNYQGLDFGANVNVSAMTTFHVDVWTFDETSLQFFQINNGGGERSYTLTPLVQGQWNSYDIPITAWTSQSGFGVNALFQFKVVGSGGKTVYFDNMYFYRPATTLPPTLSAFTVPAKLVGDAPFALTAPTSNNNPATFTYTSSNPNVATISGDTVTIVGAGTSTITATQDASGGYGTNSITATLTVTPPAAPTPIARNTWDVISLYSDAYATSSSASWGAGTGITISGNNTRYLSGSPQYRLAFTPTDVSAMTTLHIDVYALDQSSWQFRLNDKAVTVGTPVNGWTGVDILLSAYVPLGLNLATVSYFDFFNPNGANPNTSYVDNIYFYRAATLLPPTVGTFTVPAKVLGDAPFQLTPPTSNNTNPFTYSSSNNLVATVLGDIVTVVGGGSATITATQAPDGNFGPSSKSATLVVTYPAPGPSPVPPARDPARVMSVYTGTPAQVYANSPAYTLVRSSWTGATTANFNFSNGSNTCIQVNNLGFIGLVDQTERRLNVTGMTNLHIDVYVNAPLSNLFVFLLAPSDRNYSTGPLVAGWNSLSIPLTAYPGALNDIYGFKIEQNVAPNTTQIYLDNIYFSNDYFTFYADTDGDGFGDAASSVSATSQPVGYVSNNTDCDDSNIEIWRSGDFYIDIDGDGYNFDFPVVPVCYGATPPTGLTLTTLGTDCDDNDISIYRSALLYTDLDGDGYDAGSAVTCYGATLPTGLRLTTLGSDCDDTNASVHPGATEICYNNLVENCSGVPSQGCAPVVVNMTPSYNNSTLASLATAIPAVTYSYPGATNIKYRFSVKNVTTNITVPDFIQTSRFVTIPSSIHSYGAAYDIKVSAVINDEVVPFAGNTIRVNGPTVQLITLNSGTCGATLATLASTLTANAGLNATSYTFRIRLNDANPTPTYAYSQSATRFVSANSFTGFPLQYGTSYKVAVQYTFTDPVTSLPVESGYGAECTINTQSIPLVGLASPVCGSTVSALNANLSASAASYATGYQFRIRLFSDNGPTPTYYYSVPNASRFSSLTAFQGITLAYNTAYSISVQYSIISNSATVWSGYGSECKVTTPFFPTTSLVPSQCGLLTPTSLTQQLNVTPYPGFPNYKIKLDEVSGEDIVNSQEIVITYSYFRLNQFSIAQLGKNYNVSVAIKLNGVFGDYSTACDLFTAPLAKTMTSVPFKATAYPNPFANNFMLDVKTTSESSVTVKVYDMIGRLIEQRNVNVSDMQATTIGDQYPAGVYNVVVSQEDSSQTLRVVKR